MKKNKKIIIFIIVLIIVIVGLLLGLKLFSNNNTDNNKPNQNKPQYTDKMKETFHDYLKYMVGTKEYEYDNFDEVAHYDITDDTIFIETIRILYHMNKYKKQGNIYSFTLDDVSEYAKKYFNVDDFNYDVKNNSNFKYNTFKKEYESTLEKGVFTNNGRIEDFYIDSYTKYEDHIKVICTVKKLIVFNSKTDEKRVDKWRYEVKLLPYNNSYIIAFLQEYIV